jgi:sugar phosphate isomerase/epimerase
MDFSYQLYSSRNFPPIDDVLGRLAKLGYRQVEGFGGLYADATGLAASLKKHGLTMPTGHFGLAQLKDTDAALKTAETLGMRVLYCPAVPKEERSQGDDKWVELGETLAAVGEGFRKRGFGFGWHNHDFEFRPTASGRLPMDIILETAPHNDWEMDVAWVVKGGQDPIAWMKKYGARINAVHVKDIAPAGENASEDGWADVGHGTMDWAKLWQRSAAAGCTLFIAEHDKPSDAARFCRRSFAAMQQLAGAA